MSKVYNALKKAEREGRWQPAKPTSDQVEAAREVAIPAANGAAAALGGGAIPEQVPVPARKPVNPASPEAFAGPPLLAREEDPPRRVAAEHTAVSARAHPAPQVDADSSVAGGFGGQLAEFWRMLTQTDIRPEYDAPFLITNEAPTSPVAEKFQLLRVWFENWTTAHQKRVIMMSSALPGEGKSFVSLNLAVTLAAAGYRVMLVDADLRRPCLHRSFNLVPLSGLLPYLEGRAEFAECLSSVPGVPTLTLVATGGTTTSAAELMAGHRMSEFVAQARALEPPHYVLIDAPAALAAPETEILAGVVDAALLVVAANRTPRQMVKETFQLLKTTTTCGVVLNRFEPPYSTSRKVAYGYYGQPPSQSTSGLY